MILNSCIWEITLFKYPSIAATNWEIKACVYCQEFAKHCTLLKLKKTVHTGGWLWVFFGVICLL